MRSVERSLVFLFIFFILGLSSVHAQTSFQPTAPYYGTFFYLWGENPNTDPAWSYWSDNGHTPPNNWFSNYLPDPDPTKFDPATELYSSKNESIIYWQLRKLAEAKQEVAIASWWGQGHKSDVAFSKIIKDIMNRPDNPYPNLRWAPYYEKEGFGNPTVAELVSDLNYIKTNYVNQPGYFKINGKPVIFVYNAAHSGSNPTEDLSRWQQARTQTGFYVVLKVDPLNSGASPSAIDSWHEYAPANRSGIHGTDYSYVSPGFWLEGSAARLPRDLNAFKTAVSSMVASNVTWKLTETWNEWGEGSSVEPGEQVIQTKSGNAIKDPNGAAFGNQFIDALSAQLPPLEAGTGAGGGTTGDPVIAAAGDIACGTATAAGSPCKQKETADLITQINPQAVLVLGDNQYEAGSTADFNTFYAPTWGLFKQKTFPVVGNHEYGTPNATGYFDYFNGVGNQSGPAGDRSKGYYSTDIGSWHIISLNSNCAQAGGCAAGSPQEVWLKQDLASHSNVCTLAMMHHPRFSSGFEGNDATLTGQYVPFWQDLYNASADVVLTGHSHDYERFAPQTPAGALDSQSGIREFVVGTGGRDFTGWSNAAANSEAKNNSSMGVLKMTLHQSSYDWQFMPIAGSTFTDSGTGICHTAAVSTPNPSGPACFLVAGDANGDGLVTVSDFTLWKMQFLIK